MKLLSLAFLSSLAPLGCQAGELKNPRTFISGRNDGTPMRIFMTVEYDYRLEANRTVVEGNSTEDNIFNKNPLEDALLDIDTELVEYIQERLPNGDIPEGETLPDVKFNSVNSRFINMCFTESDACKWVKSRVKLSFAGNRPQSAVERVTLDLVRGYFEDINVASRNVKTMFVYPMIYASTVQFDFSPTQGPLSEGDIADLEGCFYNVYNAIVGALDGDTDVSEGYFVYQDFQQEEEGNKTIVNLQYFGKCRYCTQEELEEEINESIDAHKGTLLANLQIHSNSSYFDGVEDIAFSVPNSLDDLLIDSSIIDLNVPEPKQFNPWWLLAGAFGAVVILFIGIFVICKDQRDLRKEEAETGGESDSYEGKHHEGADQGFEAVDFCEKNESTEDPEDNINSLGDDSDQSSSLNTTSITTNGMHNDYQVYVY